ncbi:MAG: S1C family serine protease [Verrucomicrobiota bacterium]
MRFAFPQPCARLFRALLALTFGLIYNAAPRPVIAQSVFDSIGQEINGIFERTKPAMVRVRSKSDLLTLAGSGFFIDDRGTILTAATLLGQSPQVSVQIDGKWHPAEVLARDTRSGVALLKVTDDLTPFLTLGDTEDLRRGSAVIAVGYSRDQPASPTWGLVTGLDFRYEQRFFPTTHIRADVQISPGQVGGPLLDTQGDVIGLMVASIDSGKTIYALPIEAAKKVVHEVKEHGTARHGWVGVGVQPFRDSEGRPGGVSISQLFPDTPAARSGLEPGDVVLTIDGRQIEDPGDIADASFFSTVGSQLQVTVRREGKEMKFSFVVMERPRAQGGRSTLPIPANPELEERRLAPGTRPSITDGPVTTGAQEK